MNVRELIEQLSQMPKDLEVFAFLGDGDHRDIREVMKVETFIPKANKSDSDEPEFKLVDSYVTLSTL